MSFLVKEEQRFTQWWIWSIMVLTWLTTMYLCIKNLMDEAKPEGIVAFGLSLIILSLIISLLGAAKLETRLDKYGIKYRFFPFVRDWRTIEKSRIESIELVKYNALMEYGGYGYRVRWGKGTALTVKGNMGIKIQYKKEGKEKKLLIGTQKQVEVEEALQQFKHKEIIA